MASINWLPPLHSHYAYYFDIQASQHAPSFPKPGLSEPYFLITLFCNVTFVSDNSCNTSTFPGLNVETRFVLAVDDILSSRTLPQQKRIQRLLKNLRIPCEPNAHINYEVENKTGVLRRFDGLDKKIWRFLYDLCGKKDIQQENVLPIRLSVTKNITVPDSEFTAWCLWYDEKKTVDPGFEQRYAKAIRRPRTEEELYETSLHYLKATDESVIAGLPKFDTSDQGKSGSCCMICLEDLGIGPKETQLPCSHVFHGDCVVKWLRKSHMCPLCRFMLPSVQIDR